jgi:hypothetical protein
VADTIQIPVEVVLDDGSIKKSFIRIEREAEKTARNAGKEFEKGFDFSKISSSVLKFSAAVAAVGAGLAALGLKKAIDEAREGERVINSFNAALFSTGNFTQAASSRFVEYSESLERTLGVSKSVTLEGAKLLVTIGKLSGDGLERATQASLNLAAALGKDASTGFELISKAAAGNTEVLGRYGIKLDQNIPKNERFAATLKLIEDRFGGLAEQSSNTLDGALNKLNIQFGNIFENIGQLITNSPVIRKAISLIADGFGAIADKLEGLSQLSFDQFVIDAISFGRAITGVVLPAVEGLYNGFRFLFSFVKQAFEGLGFIIVENITRGLELVNGVLKKFGINALDGITTTMREISNATGQVLLETSQNTQQAFSDIFNPEVSSKINAGIDGFIAKLNEVKGTSNALKDQIKQDNEEIKNSYVGVAGAFSLVADGIVEAAAELRANASANFKAMGKAMLQGVGQAAGQAFASFGQAIVSGENALEAFGKTLLQAFGNALVQLGTGFILQGIAQSFAGFGSGGPLIAAGAALATFGGILAASAGGGAGGAVGAGGGVGGDTGGGVATAPSQTTEIDENAAVAEPKPAINVTIEGNVLDRRQTGLEIVDILQEAFDTQGARVIGAT